jgi:transcription elongation factor GreA
VRVQGILENAAIAPAPSSDEVTVLSTVKVLFEGDDPSDAETFLIGHIEEDGAGHEIMSPASPIGSALLGHKKGDKVSITLENGAKVSVTVVDISV